MGFATVLNSRFDLALENCDVLLGRVINSFDLLPSILSFEFEIFIRLVTGLLLKLFNFSHFRSVPAVYISQLIEQGFDHGGDRWGNINSANIHSCWINGFSLAQNNILQRV